MSRKNTVPTGNHSLIPADLNLKTIYKPVMSAQHRDKIRQKSKQWHEENKTQFIDSIFNSSRARLKPSDYRDIVDACLGPHRGMENRKKIARKYAISVEHVAAIEKGIDGLHHVGEAYYHDRLRLWHELYDTEIVLRSPGNDLLSFYDQQFQSQTNRGLIPPSAIYRARFNIVWEPCNQKIFKGPSKTGRKIIDLFQTYENIKNNNLAKKRYNEKFIWLVNHPHKEYRVTGYKNIVQLLHKHGLSWKMIGYGSKHGGTHKTGTRNVQGMSWNGRSAGWSWIVKRA
jgi:hypothetical protein